MSREDEDNGFAQWGGYMEAKKTKLEEQFAAASEMFSKSKLFAGISIIVNGLTNPTADELKRIMMQHGGTFHHYQRPHTTYIIASNLPDVKVRNMDTSKIISAQWVVDCVKEQRILDYTRYLLYTNQKTTQPRINFEKQNSKKEESNQSHVKSELGGILKELQLLQSKMLEPAPQSAENTVTDSVEQKPVNISNISTNTTVARTAVDPKFLSEFYNNSRLHHIATLGAGFKQYVSELRAKHVVENGFPARQQLKTLLLSSGITPIIPTMKTCVMHIDMDCFFVSVGLRNHPELRGMPVAVTHSKGGSSAIEVPVHPQSDRQAEMELFAKRFEAHLHDNIRTDKVRQGFEAKMSLSEIASCSYEARAKGIRNGMFVGQAIKMCPELKTLPYDFEGYREVAFTLYDTVAQYTLNIEAVSCDEMFVELTDVLQEVQVPPMDFVAAIRKEVRTKTRCPCSAGVGANKLQARMATKRAKPDGQYMLDAAGVVAYMAPISIAELPGVGNQTAYTLKQAQLETCSDLQQVSLARIQMLVGKKLGETLHQYSRGIDARALVYEQVRKSVSAEVNYGIRFQEYAECETFLRQLCAEVHTRLLDIKRKTKCITLKLMVRAQDAPVETSKFMGHGVCDNITKATTLTEYTNDVDKITQTILTTMKALNIPPNELRGIGIHLSKLDEPNESAKEKKENVIKNMFSKVAEKQKDKQKNHKSTECAVDQQQSAAKTEPEISEPKKSITPKKTGKRGRPPKISPQPQPKNKQNVLNLLQNAATNKKPQVTYEAIDLTKGEQIDPEVLAALPEDIRLEVLQNVKQYKDERARKPIESPSPLNESDFLPSTSKAAEEKRLNKEIQKSAKEHEVPHADPDFLAALPPDLRAEIEKDIQAQIDLKKCQTNTDEILKPNAAPATPEKAISATNDISSKTDADSDEMNLFLNKNCISLINGWVKNFEVPENVDIDVFSSSACLAIELDELDKLYNGMYYLYRLINAQRGTNEYCQWHKAYKLIEQAVQTKMRIQHGQKLKLPERIKCNICEL